MKPARLDSHPRAETLTTPLSEALTMTSSHSNPQNGQVQVVTAAGCCCPLDGLADMHRL
ncbi:MAG TPA: hypothetical protein VH183_15050 [Burkholderiaceae bacterium]|jgi:hypothetical protein|nr:hypothetical protein [Burkholderiaceae bacterium]